MELGEVISRGRAGLPEIAENAEEGDAYIYQSGAWVRLQDADSTYY
jgi:hypothetical protein